MSNFKRRKFIQYTSQAAFASIGIPSIVSAAFKTEAVKPIRLEKNTTIYQLAERWQQDCLDLKPSVVSILIGVNDYWHTLSHGYKGTAETYRNDFAALLERTKQALPNVRFIIGEPFALKGVQAVTDEWFPAFDEYRAIAKDMAATHNAVFVPYQKVFEEALGSAPASYWSFDGVHPSIPGNMLMANAWLKAVKA